MALKRRKAYIPMPEEDQAKSSLPTDPNNQAFVPDGMWQKCPQCHQTILTDDLGAEKICPHCQYHFRISSSERLANVVDKGTFVEMFQLRDNRNEDPLGFPKYLEKKEKARATTGLDEAVVTGVGEIFGYRTAVGVMDSFFMMGSMGTGLGEKIKNLFNYATEHQLPVVLFTASGGARMQEGTLSLMQMAKISIAVQNHSKAGLLYIPVLTDPTTGGVTASFAMEGDITIAEPGALIGFAGKRVIEQTIRQQLPEGFQTAEHQLQHGFIDMIVERWRQKIVIAELLQMHGVAKGGAQFES